MAGAEPDDGIFYGSDYFDKCYEFAEKLIKDGKAFVATFPRRNIEIQNPNPRRHRKPMRNRSVEENLDLFRRMKAGEFRTVPGHKG